MGVMRKIIYLITIVIIVISLVNVSRADGISELNEQIDYTDLDTYLENQTGNSFSKYVEKVMYGAEELEATKLMLEIVKSIYNGLFSDFNILSSLYSLMAVACMCMPLSMVCRSNQVSGINTSVTYLLTISIIGGFYVSCMDMVRTVIAEIIEFLTCFVPAFLMGITFSTGAITAGSIHALILFIINTLLKIIGDTLIPLVNIYMSITFANYFTKDVMFSRMQELIYSIILWGNKLCIGIVIGLGSIKSIISPGVDRLKRSTIGGALEALPVFGNLLTGASGTILGAAVVIKNAIGIVGVIAIVLIVALPVVKIGLVYVLTRLTGAIIQPIAGDKMVNLILDLDKGIYLLYRVALGASMLVLLTIMIITIGTGI